MNWKMISSCLLAMAVTSQGHANITASRPEQTELTGPIEGTIYENVCHLTIKRAPGGTSFGSAVLYKKRYLLTAGHNVFQDRSWVQNIEVRCGVTHVPKDGPTCSEDPNCQIVQGWQGRDARRFNWFRFPHRFDFGVIRLNHTIETTQPIELVDKVEEGDLAVRIAGYPGDAVDGTMVGDARTLKYANTTLKRTKDESETLWYDVLTASGNSGGPVWHVTQDGALKLLAIHIQPSRGRVVNGNFKDEVNYLIGELDKRAAKRAGERGGS